MKVFKVPLPVNFFSFAEGSFPDEVPLITSTKGKTAEQNGYWVLCSDPAEQKALIESLGLDYSKYVTAKSSLASADQYQPNPSKRDEEKKKYCSSPVLLDKVLCSLYNLAPEQQSPIICPSSLDLIDGGYDLSIYSTGTKFFAEYQNGLAALTAMETFRHFTPLDTNHRRPSTRLDAG